MTLRVLRAQERNEIAEAFRTELGVDGPLAETLEIVAAAIANCAAICHRLTDDDDEVERIVGALGHILKIADQR